MKTLNILAAGMMALAGIAANAATPVEAKADARALVEAGADAVGDNWAQVRLTAASIRTQGRHAAEMSTQAIMGTPLRVIDGSGEWWEIQTPDGYTGWIPSSSAVKKSAAEMAAWRSADRLVMTDPFQTIVTRTPEPLTNYRNVVSDLVNGCVVVRNGADVNGYTPVQLPDGREGYVLAEKLTPIRQWADQPFDAEKILGIAGTMEGIPYLWGGTSTKALDCSGLAKVSYLSNGRILMRDASQQAVTGQRIEAENWRSCQPGDLLFFGNANTGRVTHVAIYDHDGHYIHSSGRVKRNSVDPEADDYLTTPFLHAVRIAGYEGTEGITRVIEHPWYF